MKPYSTVGIRNRTLMESYGLLDSYRRSIAGSECIIEKAFEAGVGFSARTCYHVEDRERLRILMEKEAREGVYTQEFFDAIDKTYKNTVQDIKTFWHHDFSRRSNPELISFFDRYYQIYITTLHPMVVAIYVSDLQDLFDSELHKITGDISLEERLEYTALLLTPTRLTTVQKEDQVLFDLQARFEKEHPQKTAQEYEQFADLAEVKNIFDNLERNFGWFHMEYIGEPCTARDYAHSLWQRIEDLKEEKTHWKDQTSPQERIGDIIKRQKEFFDHHKEATLLRNLVFAMQEFLVVLDFSKADLVEGIYYARPLVSEIARRIGLDWITVRFLLPNEIKELLESDKKVNVDFVKDRMAHFALILDNFTITSFFGDTAEEKIDQLLEKEIATNIKEFKGITAYPGKVRGKATIVTSAKDRDKFERGNILITRETTTELTSIIKKSLAIVADQGSLLSHTAIVSREFKIPCLILTKIGTQVVKDGDYLEVDATNGIVKILDT